MSPTSSLKSFFLLAAGLLVGGAGAVLFRDSLPGAEGSPEQQARSLESDLKRAQIRIAELEAANPRASRPGQTVSDGLRGLAEDIRDGKPVSPDDVFRRTQPLLRDLAPLFERIRIRGSEAMAESMAGELTRKYNLTPAQQENLKKWFAQKAEDDAKDWTDLVSRKGTTLDDLARESRNQRPDQGLDAFMETTLSGEKLATFKSERATQKAERIQQEADMRVERLSSIVQLDDTQRDQVFGIMARNSPEYDASIKLEGAAGDIGNLPSGSREEATLSVLRPEQREAYLAERQSRRDAAEKDMRAIGLTLPESWNFLDQ